MKNSATKAYFLVILFAILKEIERTEGDPRAQIVQIMCGTLLVHNTTLFVSNLVNTMATISNKLRTMGYGTAVTGSGVDIDYGLVQCYGDLSMTDCTLCYAEARSVIPQCFPINAARVFLDGCFMRADNYSFYEEYTGPGDRAVCGNTTRKNSAFGDSVREIVTKAASAAPKNRNFFARGQMGMAGSANESAYVLADCWRTLNENSCRACLGNASASILGCLPWSEGRAIHTGCFMRYSDIDFLNPETSSGRSRGTKIVIAVVVIGSAILCIVGAAAAFYIQKHIQKKRKGSNDAAKLAKNLIDSSLNFKYSTIEKATNSFAEANKIGQGGFGTVYKGTLQDGREIAVKRLFFNSIHIGADFFNEVNVISSVDHKNLIRFLGCSCLGPESLLIYEFLQNQSLDRFIFDPTRGKALNWERRFEIIIGTAEGLVYLHENTKTRIIHRDIKASNILLDARFRAKIADFGLARSFQRDKSHISTAIAGTLGYMAPEYLAHGQLTEKADVYSFGVLLLEVVTGMQNNRSRTSEDLDSMVSVAWNHFQQRTVEELLDPNLMWHNSNVNAKMEALRVVHVALLCTQEAPSLRPYMPLALRMLTKNDQTLPPPTNPPFLDERTMELNDFTGIPRHQIHGYDTDSVATTSSSLLYPR